MSTSAQGYRVPVASVRVEHEVSRSRFIASLANTPTVQSAREIIAAIRAEMPDASHHVYAFKVGYGASVIEGMSDDGEPTGTAGPPVMAVLRGAEIIERRQLGLTLPYPLYERARMLALELGARIDDETFAGDVTIYLTLPLSSIELFSAAIRDLSAGQIAPIELS